jgi:3-deoxy-D-manno-octulosonate 8-phosphate phosphatase (KDO 8-P phosphatase)
MSMNKLSSTDIKNKAANIKLILMDVDGVLTDGSLYYFPGPDGKVVEFKGFNSQDGVGFHMLNDAGIKSGVISGRESPAVVERAKILNITYVYQGHLAKEASYEEILKEAKLKDEQVAFIGDDFTDAPLMVRCGLSVAVANARQELRAMANYTTEAPGGDGAVREVIELVLKSQNLWEKALEKYKLSQTTKKKTIGL